MGILKNKSLYYENFKYSNLTLYCEMIVGFVLKMLEQFFFKCN